jgi:hypothetical protein
MNDSFMSPGVVKGAFTTFEGEVTSRSEAAPSAQPVWSPARNAR